MADDLTLAAGRDYGDTLWTPTPESAARTEIVRYIRWLAANGVLFDEVRVDAVGVTRDPAGGFSIEHVRGIG